MAVMFASVCMGKRVLAPAGWAPIQPKMCLMKGICSRMDATTPSIGPGMPACPLIVGLASKYALLTYSPVKYCQCYTPIECGIVTRH